LPPRRWKASRKTQVLRAAEDGRPGRHVRPERVYDRQAVQRSPIPQIFRHKKAQARPDRGGAQQRIPEGDVVRTDKIESRCQIGLGGGLHREPAAPAVYASPHRSDADPNLRVAT
jgi:hypothetical protein